MRKMLSLLMLSLVFLLGACLSEKAPPNGDSAYGSKQEEAKASGDDYQRYEEELAAAPTSAVEPMDQGFAGLDDVPYDIDGKDLAKRHSADKLGDREPPKEAQEKEPKKRRARMVVYRARLQLQSHQPSTALNQAETLVNNAGGYVQSSNLQGRVLRVPSARYKEVLSQLQELGEVTHLTQSSQDITDAYSDIAARIENLEKLQARYTLLLANATTMQERLAIEKELRRIEKDLRVLQERKRFLAHEAAYATIHLNVYSPAPQRTADTAPQPFPWVRELGPAALL